MAELKINITANVADANQGLNAVQLRAVQLEENIKKLQNTIANTTSQRKLSSALEALNLQQKALAQVSVAASQSLSKLPGATNQATTAVGNLSRVVQDAPFGFIAISNNLQPLFDDFNRLKSQTGSVGGAFKGLLGAIAGPAGIGLAFAAATSLVTVFSKELFGSGAAAKKAKDDVAEFKKSLDGAQASALSTGLQLQKFVEIAKNGNLPLEQRNEALKKANDILGDYGQKLTLTNIATARATELVNQYTQGLIAQALANQYADRAATLLINQAAAQKQVTEAQLQYNKAQAAFINRPQLSLREQELGKGQSFIIDRDKALKTLNQSQEDYARITKEVTNITTQFNEQALKSTNLLGNVGTKVKGKVNVELEPVVSISKLTLEEAQQADLFGRGGIFTEELQNKIQEGFKKLKPIKVDAKISPELQFLSNQFNEKIKEGEKRLDEFTQTVNSSLANIQVQGLASVGEAIGAALTGGNLQTAFQAFGNVIASGLEAIGKQLIIISGVAKIAKEALATLFTNPGAALAAGIALVAVGSALRSSLSEGIQARALGGPVSGGTPYLVGERGPELFVPQVSGGIVPNNSVGSFMSGRGSDSGRGSVLRGQDIILAYARTQRSQLRVNG
jgi:hypothetical protein